jgi:hypothetical protein
VRRAKVATLVLAGHRQCAQPEGRPQCGCLRRKSGRSLHRS